MSQIPVLVPQALTVVAVLSLGLGLVGLVVAVVAVRRAARLEGHYRALMTGVDGVDLAAALEAQAARLAEAQRRVAALEGASANLSARLAQAIQRVRLVRYSAFDDAGGDQSFALALLDDAADGVVISGLYGRGAMRVYAKPVSAGRSSYSLTDEEAQVIEQAQAGVVVGG